MRATGSEIGWKSCSVRELVLEIDTEHNNMCSPAIVSRYLSPVLLVITN